MNQQQIANATSLVAEAGLALSGVFFVLKAVCGDALDAWYDLCEKRIKAKERLSK